MTVPKTSMTVAEFAAHRGCSDSLIRRFRRQGRLVLTADGSIDVAKSEQSLADSLNAVRGGPRQPPPAEPAAQLPAPIQPGVSLHEAQRRERLALARTAELKLGEHARDLTRVAIVHRDVFTLAREALERLRNIGSRLRFPLAAESDPAKIEVLLNKEIEQVCKELRQTAEKLAGRLAGREEADDHA